MKKDGKILNQEHLFKKAKEVILAIQKGKITAYRVGVENLSFTTALGLLQYHEDHPELFSGEK